MLIIKIHRQKIQSYKNWRSIIEKKIGDLLWALTNPKGKGIWWELIFLFIIVNKCNKPLKGEIEISIKSFKIAWGQGAV